jgi:hypothetical protein
MEPQISDRCFHKKPLSVPILCQMYPAHTLPFILIGKCGNLKKETCPYAGHKMYGEVKV